MFVSDVAKELEIMHCKMVKTVELYSKKNKGNN